MKCIISSLFKDEIQIICSAIKPVCGTNHFPFSCPFLCSKLYLRVVCAYLSSLTLVIVHRESDKMDEDGGSNNHNGKRQLKLSNVGFNTSKRRSEEIESSGKGRSRFFQARKLEHLTYF